MTVMFLPRSKALQNYPSRYAMEKAVAQGELHKVAHGLYSQEQFLDPLHVAMHRWPNAVITMDSAFFYYGLTDVIPTKTHLATARNATRITDSHFKQYFLHPDLLNVGVVTVNHMGQQVRIFSRERLLVELMRSQARIPLSYYAEIIHAYRDKVSELDTQAVEEYIGCFKYQKKLLHIWRREVL